MPVSLLGLLLLASPVPPAHAQAVEEFIPAGYQLRTRVDGDFDGDGVPDAVLWLDPTEPKGQRILAYLRGAKGGGFDRLHWRRDLLSPLGDEGTLGSIEISREGQNLAVYQTLGGDKVGRQYWLWFRWDAKRGSMTLVAHQTSMYDRRNKGVLAIVVVDHLTGHRRMKTIKAGLGRAWETDGGSIDRPDLDAVKPETLEWIPLSAAPPTM